MLLTACSAVVSVACSSDDPESDESGADSLQACGAIVAEADCDTRLAPIVFIHGTFGSANEVSNVSP